MNKPHKHAELIKAWADGAKIQVYNKFEMEWMDITRVDWYPDMTYRIKPEPKPDIVRYIGLDSVDRVSNYIIKGDIRAYVWEQFVKLTFDGETGKLKSAEVINND